MASERTRRLAQKIKEAQRLATEGKEIQLLAARMLAARGPKFWHDFNVAVVEESEALKAQIDNWDDFAVGLDTAHRLIIEKHANPYVHARLELDMASACIKGSFKHAKERPGNARLAETPLLVDLRLDPADAHIYAVAGGEQFHELAELAGWLLETVVSGGADTL